jgi:hypothetical protein
MHVSGLYGQLNPTFLLSKGLFSTKQLEHGRDILVSIVSLESIHLQSAVPISRCHSLQSSSSTVAALFTFSLVSNRTQRNNSKQATFVSRHQRVLLSSCGFSVPRRWSSESSQTTTSSPMRYSHTPRPMRRFCFKTILY